MKHGTGWEGNPGHTAVNCFGRIFQLLVKYQLTFSESLKAICRLQLLQTHSFDNFLYVLHSPIIYCIWLVLYISPKLINKG